MSEALIKKVKNYERRFGRLAKSLVNESDRNRLELKVIPGGGSYSTKNGRNIRIVIDPTMAYDENDTLASLLLKVEGIVAHEASHIAFSDFNVVKDNKIKELSYQQAITEVARQIKKDVSNEDLKKDLHDAVYGYIYYKNLANMLNSIEDAAIEYQICRRSKSVYGSVIAMRDFIQGEEVAYLQQLEKNSFDSRNKSIENYITEVRHYAVVGYRTELKPLYLPKVLSKDEIEKIATLAFYERVCSANTNERNIASQVLLDMLKPILDEVVDRCYDSYLNSLLNGGNSDIDAAAASSGAFSTELVIESYDPNMAGANSMVDVQSEYNMRLPDDVEEQLQQKAQQQQQGSGAGKSSQNSSGQSDSNHGQNSGQGDSSSNSGENDNSDSNQSENGQADASSKGDPNISSSETGSQQDSGEKSGENQDGNQDGQSSNGSQSGDDMSQNSSDGSDGDSGKEGDEKSDKKGGEKGDGDSEGNQSKESGQGSKGGENDSDSKSIDAGEMLEKNREVEADNAKSAKAQSLSQEMKGLQKNVENDIKNDIMNPQRGDGKAPKLSNGLSYPDSISECHQGVKVKYHPSKSINGPSYYGEQCDLNSVKKQATVFSKHLKEILMYQAKSRRLNGLKSGNLNNAALSRIITDQKVFKKTIKGKVKKGRIEVLMDLSGSMSGRKMVNAISAAYMLASACQKCKVPISVMGHYDSQNVELFHFLEFEDCMKIDAKDKILAADCGGCNRDGLAIFHAATDLVRHGKRDEQKILIVISDGAPNGGWDYCGDYAKDDIQHIEKVFEKQFGVKMIGIGIGDDVEDVPDIYKNHVIVPEVEELGDELLKIMKDILID